MTFYKLTSADFVFFLADSPAPFTVDGRFFAFSASFLASLSFLLLSSKSRMSSSQSKFSRGSQVFSSLEGEDETQTNKCTGVNFLCCAWDLDRPKCGYGL